MSRKVVATNKKAFHDFHIEETMEAGIVLKGSEVKSLRAGKVNLRDSYAKIKNGEIFLVNVHISPYSHATYDRQDPRRQRKLLLHRREIRKLIGKVQERGFSLVPLRIYFNERGKAKVELALARGKRRYDRRQAIARREADREMRRALRHKG